MATTYRYTYRFSVHELPAEALAPADEIDFLPPGPEWVLLSWELATQRKAVVLWQRYEADDG